MIRAPRTFKPDLCPLPYPFFTRFESSGARQKVAGEAAKISFWAKVGCKKLGATAAGAFFFVCVRWYENFICILHDASGSAHFFICNFISGRNKGEVEHVLYIHACTRSWVRRGLHFYYTAIVRTDTARARPSLSLSHSRTHVLHMSLDQYHITLSHSNCAVK
jgi:hypothetical protein